MTMAQSPGKLPDAAFWAGKRVLLTGHTGFKGAWATAWLARLGAEVHGLSLAPEGSANLFDLARIGKACRSHILDLRDGPATARLLADLEPEIVIHMAAQSLVRRSYMAPAETFATNVMGSVNLLEAIRHLDAPPAAVLAVTTDKVYANDESGRAFVESDPLGGHDPYSASKAAMEHAVASYSSAFLAAKGVNVATARGGNVIGGGDFNEDRLVPDIVRSIAEGKALELRNPDAVRPWQHVLDCLSGYFVYAESLAQGRKVPKALNFGPDPSEPIPVRDVVRLLQGALSSTHGWEADERAGPREMLSLSLDPRLARQSLDWVDRLSGRGAIEWTAQWYAAFLQGHDAAALMNDQIERYQARQTDRPGI